MQNFTCVAPEVIAIQPEVKKMFAQPPVVIVYIICTQKYYHKIYTLFSMICYRLSVYGPK